MNKKQLIVVWVIGIILFLAGLGYFIFPYYYSQLSNEDLDIQRSIYILTLFIYLIIILRAEKIRTIIKRPKSIIWVCGFLISLICLRYITEPFRLDVFFVSFIPILIIGGLSIYTLRNKKK